MSHSRVADSKLMSCRHLGNTRILRTGAAALTVVVMSATPALATTEVGTGQHVVVPQTGRTAAAGESSGGSAARPHRVRYRLCGDPQRHPGRLVLAVHGVSCHRAHSVAEEWKRRYRRYGNPVPAAWGHFWGWSCGGLHHGTYEGHFGQRVYCHAPGGPSLRFDNIEG